MLESDSRAPARPGCPWRTAALTLFLAALLCRTALGAGADTGASPAGAPPAQPAASEPPLNEGLGAAPEGYDVSTPRRAWQGFLDAARSGSFEAAAHYLDLSEVPPDQQRILGPDTASKLHRVLSLVGVPKPAGLPDQVDPAPATPDQRPGTWLLAQVSRDGLERTILLERVVDPATKQPRWLVSKGAVAATAGMVTALLERKEADARKEVRKLNEGLGELPEGLDRSTPRRALRSYIDLCRIGLYPAAAHLIWLNDVPRAVQPERGAELARQLKIVIDQVLWVNFEELSDEPFGKPELSPVPEDEDEFGEVKLRGSTVPLRLRRVAHGTPEEISWVIAPVTVEAVSDLYAVYGLGWLGMHLPSVLTGTRILEMELWQWAGLAVVIPFAVVFGLLIQRLLARIGGAISVRTATSWDDRLLAVMDGPLQAILILLLTLSGVRMLRLAVPVQEFAGGLMKLAMLMVVSWLLMRMVTLVTDLVSDVLIREAEDELQERSIKTRLNILRQLVLLLVGVLALAYVLMQFSAVRALGAGLLASAGVTGIAIGFAAQKSLANLFAGLTLGLTQPVRIGDNVVFEGEWGWIEQISLTHVVIKIWDLRRLVVPISYLLERPILNWTKFSPDILGTVYFYADYTVDVAALREEVMKILRASPLWDGKAGSLLVTDLKEQTVELRALVSARHSGDQWDLRCHMREKILEAMQRGDRPWLPVTRVLLDRSRAEDPKAGPAAPPT